MFETGFTAVELLNRYVSFIKKEIKTHSVNIYPILGAHGPEFFIELSSGDLISRDILLTIAIKFGETNMDYELAKQAIANHSEIYVGVLNYAYLIAFLGLLEKSFKGDTKILHPLNNTGDFLPGWNQAIAMVSS
ncbi:hypothetical protein [Methylotenera sp.]|uniref:hypothetical protein n=1 Tax=Methylotenera sp. TaxID=2051956 RepID=UPI002ED853B1